MGIGTAQSNTAERKHIQNSSGNLGTAQSNLAERKHIQNASGNLGTEPSTTQQEQEEKRGTVRGTAPLPAILSLRDVV